MLDNYINEHGYYIDCHFIPCVNWFKISIKEKYIKIYEFERWQKMSFLNRCTLLGGNGLVNLSVPVENGRDQKGLFRDIKISYSDNWQIKFWRTIISCYNRAPFFVYYREDFERILMTKYTFLRDLNIDLIRLCINYLGVNKDIIIVNDNNLNRLNARDHYLTPQTFQLDPRPLTYHQMFGDRFGFQANLSVVDLLFMEGPEAYSLLANG